MVNKYYSITELEELSNIPDSTIRRYISKFPDFFIYQSGRVKKYEESAVKVLIRIKQLFDDGLGTAEVDRTLRNDFPTIVTSGEEEDKSHSPALATAEDIAEIKKALAEQKEFNKMLVEKLDQQERYIKESLEQRDQLLLEQIDLRLESKRETAAEVAATKEAEEKKSFWTRIFGK